MCGKSRQGFTFIELMVVILLLGIMAAIVVPNLQQRLPGHKRKEFISELNTLLALCWQSALATQTVHRVFFDLEKKVVRVEIQEVGPTEKEIQYKPIPQAYRKTFYEWPETIVLRNFFIEGVDEINKPEPTVTIWFYILPDGISQNVVINVEDTSQTPSVALGLVLNPFTAQLKEYDTFQKP